MANGIYILRSINWRQHRKNIQGKVEVNLGFKQSATVHPEEQKSVDNEYSKTIDALNDEVKQLKDKFEKAEEGNSKE